MAPAKGPPLLPLAGPSSAQAAAGPSDPQPGTSRDVAPEDLDASLSFLAQDLSTDDDFGPELTNQLAEVLNNILGKKLSEDKLKTRIEDNPPPRNIPLLHPPRVNECIWELIKSGPRSSDIRMKKIQVRLTRGLVALARLTDKVLLHKKAGTFPNLAELLDLAL